jgi:MarR family transcriptional regulator, transcriptional regulator for hemolysin
MEPIENVILFLIDQTSRVAKQYSQREFDKAELGITVDQWVLLKIIDEKKALSQIELAKFSVRDPASITRTLDLLEKKELIEREAIEDNRRQYRISLTKKGNKFVIEHLKMVSKQRAKSIKGISKQELDNLRNTLLQIQKNMT